MSSSDELDVSVDAISAGPTPGQKLRLAREARGFSLDYVTAETNLSPKYLQALEADDYAALPGLAFARGYARRYAQLVNLDGSLLIAEMDMLAAAQGVIAPASLSASSSAMQRTNAGISQVASRKASDSPSSLTKTLAGLQQVSLAQVLSLGSLVLLVLLLLGTLFWQSNNDNTEPMTDNGIIDIDADLAQQVPAEASLSSEPEVVAPLPIPAAETVPSTIDAAAVVPDAALPASVSPETTASVASLTAPVPAPTSATPASVAPAPTVVPVLAMPAKAPVAKPVGPAPAIAAPAIAPAPAFAKPVPVSTVIPIVAVPAKPVAAPPGIDSLNFSFTGKSWISVRDATGQELVYGLKNAGQTVTVTGQAPFSINIGNVNVTALSRNGRGVNLKQYARGEIASFRLAPAPAPKP